jgi:hypothetical protein
MSPRTVSVAVEVCTGSGPFLLNPESGVFPHQIGIRIQMWEVQRPGAVPSRKNSFLIIFMKKAVNFIFKNLLIDLGEAIVTWLHKFNKWCNLLFFVSPFPSVMTPLFAVGTGTYVFPYPPIQPPITCSFYPVGTHFTFFFFILLLPSRFLRFFTLYFHFFLYSLSHIFRPMSIDRYTYGTYSPSVVGRGVKYALKTFPPSGQSDCCLASLTFLVASLEISLANLPIYLIRSQASQSYTLRS